MEECASFSVNAHTVPIPAVFKSGGIVKDVHQYELLGCWRLLVYADPK